MTMIEPELVSSEEAGERGLADLLVDASHRPIAVDTSQGQVVIMRRDMIDQVVDRHEDFLDALLVVTRAVTDPGNRTSLDDVIAELELTEDEIQAAAD